MHPFRRAGAIVALATTALAQSPRLERIRRPFTGADRVAAAEKFYRETVLGAPRLSFGEIGRSLVDALDPDVFVLGESHGRGAGDETYVTLLRALAPSFKFDCITLELTPRLEKILRAEIAAARAKDPDYRHASRDVASLLWFEKEFPGIAIFVVDTEATWYRYTKRNRAMARAIAKKIADRACTRVVHVGGSAHMATVVVRRGKRKNDDPETPIQAFLERAGLATANVRLTATSVLHPDTGDADEYRDRLRETAALPGAGFLIPPEADSPYNVVPRVSRDATEFDGNAVNFDAYYVVR